MVRAKKVQSKGLEERLARLEALLDLLVRAALRGRAMPAEQKRLKSYLSEQSSAARKAAPLARGPDCPACRMPLPEGDPVRCPSCLVLLEEARRSARALRRQKSVV